MQQTEITRILQSIFSTELTDSIGTDGIDEIYCSSRGGGESLTQPQCHQNQEDLSAYIDAELDGQAVETLYPALHLLLTTCESCQAVYAELKTMLAVEQLDTFVTPALVPRFDFSYLSSLQEPVVEGGEHQIAVRVIDYITWRLLDAGQLVVSLSDEFIQSLSPTLQQPVFLKSAGSALFAVSSPGIADDLSVAMSAWEKRHSPNAYQLVVGTEIPSRGGWPNGDGTKVTLSIRGAVVGIQFTDAFGKAFFDDITREDLGQLSVAVEVIPVS